MSVNASYRFLSFVRAGMSGLVSAIDNLGQGGAIPAVASVDISVPVTGADYQDDSAPKPDTVAKSNVSLLSPGEIIGINPRQVIRTFPRDGTTNAETTMFPLIEFDRPDLPWMFTPAQGTPDGRLRPWLCLVVVERRDGVTFGPLPEKPLPVLSIDAPASIARELPSASDAWLWAHAQIVGQSGGAVSDVLAQPSALTLSRLIAPRHLLPDTAYLACVVPTFETGRKAGLGEPITPEDEAALTPAWTPAATSVRLPVYYHFEFSTAEAGDFESLAELLQPRPAPDTLGHQPMDVTHPGSGLPDIVPADPSTPGAIFELQGALRAPHYQTPDWPQSARKPYADKLTDELNTPHRLAQPAGGGPNGELTVGPPLYGQWAAAAPEINGTEPLWMRDLDLDPGNRVAASLAEAVVEADAEDLMAAAWDQIGAVNEANRALRAAQLGREILQRFYDRHVLTMTNNDALHATAPVHARVLADQTQTVRALIAQSALPVSAVTTVMRRTLRTQGPIARFWRIASASTAAVTVRLAKGEIVASPAVRTPDGAVALSDPVPVLGETLANAVAERLGTPAPGAAGLRQHIADQNAVLQRSPGMLDRVNAIRNAPPSAFRLASTAAEFAANDRIAATAISVRARTTGRVATERGVIGTVMERVGAARGSVLLGTPVHTGTIAPSRPAVMTDTSDAAMIRSIAASFGARVIVAADAPLRPLGPALPESTVRKAIAVALVPATSVLARMNHRLGLDLTVRPGFVEVPVRDPLDGIMAAPVFTRPMYEALRDHFQDFLVPGLDQIQPNTITLVATNPTFVEAFLIGLNHAMARKLLWREYPTDQRGTYFKRFWGDTDDIGPIPAFDTGTSLGSHVAGGAKPNLVLLVRGELLRRYPSAIVYAVPATGGMNAPVFDDSRIVMPIFRGTLPPDFTFIGFPLTLDQVQAGIPNANPNLSEDYWFIIAEHPTEPRFGLHNPQWDQPLSTPVTPDDITWAHVAHTSADLDALGYAPTVAPFPPLFGAQIDPTLHLRYGQDAGAQAHLTFRNPVRVAMHANDVLDQVTHA